MTPTTTAAPCNQWHTLPNGKAEEWGYPDDAVVQCCRAAPHERGPHIAVLVVSVDGTPGFARFSWEDADD